MGWEHVAWVKGSKGDRGLQGIQGLPGVNAVDNDTAFAGYLNTAGESASKDAVTFLSPATRQAWLYATAMKKLRTGLDTTIVVRGDSLVYGYDANSSDKVPPPADVLPDGSTYTDTRSPAPYPSVLQNCLSGVYTGAITVVNQGYSGDWVNRGIQRWLVNPYADLTFIQYGINDATGASIPAEYQGNVQKYVEDLERMILRDLYWGSAVVLLTATKQRTYQSSILLDVFRSSLYSLASRYGIPVIDAEPFTAGYGMDIYSDGNHFNTSGYSVFGSKLASVLIGEGPHRPFRVTSGTALAVRPTIDNCVLRGASALGTTGIAGGPAEGTTDAVVVRPTAYAVDGFVHYSVYTDAPDLTVIPVVYMTNSGSATCSWVADIDFGVPQSDNVNDYLVGQAPDTTTRAVSQKFLTYTTAATSLNFLESGVGGALPGSTVPIGLRIASPGWHTIRVKLNTSNANGLVSLMGLQFANAQTLYLHQRINALP